MRIDERPVECEREQSRNERLYAIYSDGHAASRELVEELMDMHTSNGPQRHLAPGRKQMLPNLRNVVLPGFLLTLGERLIKLCEVCERVNGRGCRRRESGGLPFRA